MGLAAVVGTGRQMWEDWEQVPADATVFAVNHAGLFLPRAQHLVSHHHEFIGGVGLSRRALKGGCFLVHSAQPAPGVTNLWPEEMYPWSGFGGTSALFACRIALLMGFDRIVLAGVPLDGRGHFYDPPTTASPEIPPYREAWDDRRVRECVRSLSGWTRAYLGAPE